MCVDNYGGLDCSQAFSPSLVLSSVLPGPDNYPLTRVGQSLVNCPSDRSLLYVFGGLSLSQVLLGGLWRLNVTSRRWELIDAASSYQPSPRSDEAILTDVKQLLTHSLMHVQWL